MSFLDTTSFIRSVRIEWDQIDDRSIYPFCLPIFSDFESLDLDTDVTFLVGENGSGKSTLLEAIAIQYGLNPEWGSKNFSFSTRDSHSPLSQYLKINKGIIKPKDAYFLRSESYYNVASNIDDLDNAWWFGPPIKDSYGWESLHDQSHGESFFALFRHRFFGDGIYLLDEPEAALSPQRQLAFLVRMKELIDKRSQFIIATHSPIMLGYPGAKIYECSSSGLQEISYEQTDHYRLTKDFLENPTYMLSKMGII